MENVSNIAEEPERGEWVYVTTETPPRVMRVDLPFGLIAPPTIDLHQPTVGPVTFYHASSYGLRVPR
jgi:hypothetical protein